MDTLVFSQTTESIAYASEMRTGARQAALWYGPFTLLFLLAAAWVKVGRSSLAPYMYSFTLALVVFQFYYVNIVRRGGFFNKTIRRAEVSRNQLHIETNSWVMMSAKFHELTIDRLAVTERKVMNVEVYQLSDAHTTVYLIRDSLHRENELLALLGYSASAVVLTGMPSTPTPLPTTRETLGGTSTAS